MQHLDQHRDSRDTREIKNRLDAIDWRLDRIENLLHIAYRKRLQDSTIPEEKKLVDWNKVVFWMDR